MASVRSLGIYKPSALPFLVEEGILPPDPVPESYRWRSFSNDGIDENAVEEELLYTNHCVVWSRAGIIQQVYRFDIEQEDVVDAVFTNFPSSVPVSPNDEKPSGARKNQAFNGSGDLNVQKTRSKKHRHATPSEKLDGQKLESDGDREEQGRSPSRALVVVLKTQAHICFIGENSHVVQIPFEVEAVFPSIQGLLLQRKMIERTTVQPTPTLPSAPNNTFSYSQSVGSDTLGTRPTLAAQDNSTDYNQPFLPFFERLKSSFMDENIPQLPRTFSLVDPLTQLSPVVHAASGSTRSKSTSNAHHTRQTAHLDASEKLLYVSPKNEMCVSQEYAKSESPLSIALTVNERHGLMSLWVLTFVGEESTTVGRGLVASQNGHAARRRSSFNSRLSTGASTPIPKSFRQTSFQESSEYVDSQPLNSVFEQTNIPAKSSRRISSLLARSDLSLEQDRASFTDLITGAHGTRKSRRGPSFGVRNLEAASFIKDDGMSMSATAVTDARSSLDAVSMQGMPHSTIAEDSDIYRNPSGSTSTLLRSDTSQAKGEILFRKIYSLTKDESESFYGTLKYHDPDIHVFTLQAPGPNLTNLASGDLSLCVMNRGTGEFIIFQIQIQPRSLSTRKNPYDRLPKELDYELKVNGTRRSGLLDACKVCCGSYQRILVLDGRANTLTLQAPWSNLLKIDLPSPLNLTNPFEVAIRVIPESLHDVGGSGGKRTMLQSLKNISSLRQAPCQGHIDLVDKKRQIHRLKIQLKPASHFVHKAIMVCQAILPLSESNAEVILRGWWDSMSWLTDQHGDHADLEFTAFFVVILCMGAPFAAGNTPSTPQRQKKRKGGLLRSSSGANTDLESWDEMFQQQSGITGTSPQWMQNSSSWSWVKSQSSGSFSPDQKTKRYSTSHYANCIPIPSSTNSMTHFVELAREFSRSHLGQVALGRTGYLPVALSKDSTLRKTALPSILVALHLYREELKLDVASALGLQTLTPLLAQLGTWLDWPEWSSRSPSYYTLESIELSTCAFEEAIITGLPIVPQPFSPPSIFEHLELIYAKGNDVPRFPDLLEIVGAPTTFKGDVQQRIDTILMDLTPRTLIVISLLRENHGTSRGTQVSRMAASKLTITMLETLPESVAVSFRAALATVRSQPWNNYNQKVLQWVDRDDVLLLGDGTQTQHIRVSKQTQASSLEHVNRDVHQICTQALEVENVGPYDGSAEVDRQTITRLLFREDQRFAEAAGLVHPLNYPIARCIPEPGWSESDLLEAQQDLAKIVAMRTLSVSLGRSVIFFGARLPMLTEKYPVHGFTLSCTMRPSDTTVTADKAIFTEDKVSWAFFHAGVESGLSISRYATGIDTSWILFNKPRELTNRHAGFLLALGLNGHLKEIAKWVAFKYLTPKHNMTSIGFLLGVSASYIGTMDTLITRLLSVHVTRMLPPGAAELNLSPLTQTCGIMGIGLVYCNTQHRRMSEILLSELEYMEVDDGGNPMENLRDEGYRLAAGFALGLINLGCGKDLKGLQDMHVAERLLNLAVATKIVDQVHVSDNTTAGAIVAIALIFMKSNDKTLALKIDIPDTVHQYDYVRPDHFLLRTVTKCLIMWASIRANHAWIQAQLPAVYRRIDISAIEILSSEDLPYYNIIAGLCFAIALRFAGSGDVGVRDVLCSYLDHLMRLNGLVAPNYDAKLARITVRNCQDLVALSTASVMAGTGDLVVLRRLRSLHGRTDGDTTFGSHLAAHFAIGLLFLAGGTHTLGTSNLAVASLLCAFYPLFPAAVLDNKSHLQAFRHFWVFASEPRCLVPRSIDDKRPLSIPIVITDKAGNSIRHRAPCLLPDLSTIVQIQSADPDYWPVTLDFSANPKHLSSFRRHQSIFLRRRNAYEATDSSVFSATMKTLTDKHNAYQLRKQPFDWLFDLPSFQKFDRAERALLLPSDGGELGSSLSKLIRSSVIDDRLILETTCLDSGRREQLWNLRLLLRWAEECNRRGEGLEWLRLEVVARLRTKVILWSKK